MCRAKNEANAERYDRVIAYCQEAVRAIPGVSLMVVEDDAGLRDGVVFLMLPGVVEISKPTMHSIYAAAFASDETSLTASRQHRFRFIVRKVWTDGAPVPSGT